MACGVGLHIETRTCLGGKFVVAVNRGGRVLPMEREEKRGEGFALGGRTRVFRCSSVGSKTAYVTDAEAVRVVTATVGADFRYGPTGVYASVEVDEVVVANVGHAACLVPTAEFGFLHFPTLARGCAVDYEFGHFHRSEVVDGLDEGAFSVR